MCVLLEWISEKNADAFLYVDYIDNHNHWFSADGELIDKFVQHKDYRLLNLPKTDGSHGSITSLVSIRSGDATSCRSLVRWW